MIEVWYRSEANEILLVYQRMLDEWVFEEIGFYSPQYWCLPPYVFHDDAVFIGWL